MSKSKIDWHAQYKDAIRYNTEKQLCASCGQKRYVQYLDRHHPYGRHGKWILFYVYLCHGPANGSASCGRHHWIHDHAAEARKLGWLQPPFWGMSDDPSLPRPWKYLPDG